MSWMVSLLLACGPRGDDLPSLMASAERKGLSASVLVVHRDEVLLDAAYGEAVRDELPFRTGTVSSMGSLTKQFTGAAVLAAEEDGLLSLSDRIADHLPGVPSDKAHITLHELLTHRSGFRASVGPDEEVLRRGAWLEEVFESILPQGIEHTGYDDPSWQEVDVAHGYRRRRVYGPPLALDGEGGAWHVVGNGELLTTTADLRRWVEALADGEVLSEGSMNRLWTEQVSVRDGVGYGYGWGVEEQEAGRVVEHDGSNGFYFAHLAYFVDEDLFICFLANDYRSWQKGLVWDIAEVVLP